MTRPSRWTPWRERFEEILADGEWHTADELIREGSKLIPPGLGFRKAETHRRRPKDPTRGSKGPRTKSGIDDSDIIASGQRSMMNQALLTCVTQGTMERKWEDRVRFFRSIKGAEALKLRLAGEMREEVLKALSDQIVYWERAFNLMGSNRAVRDALIGGAPTEEIEKLIERIKGEWVRD